MKSKIYVVYCLTVTMLLTSFYGEVKLFLARPDPYLHQINQLSKINEAERLRHLVTVHEFEDFRQFVATLLPQAIKEKGPGEQSYQLRTLASVTQKSSSDQLMTLRAASVFEEGRTLFRAGRYPEASLKFETLIKKHAYSAHILEALFLKLECHFQMRQFDQAIRVIDTMVDTFPDSELTGYAMLRVGKIYELQDRFDEANKIYQTVLLSFPDRSLASAARDHLQ